MKYKLTPLITCLIISFFANAQAKVVGECTLTYDVLKVSGDKLSTIGVKKVFIKGSQCKMVLSTPSIQQSLLFNTQEDSAVVLKEIGASKFYQKIKYPSGALPSLIAMKPIAKDSTIILHGYLCKQLELSFDNGSIYEVTYTTEIIPTVANFEWAFKEVPGLVLSYLIKDKEQNWVLYKSTAIDLNPINISQFETNLSLYQILTTKN